LSAAQGSGGEPRFTFTDDPDLPGWKRWELTDPTRFNALFGPLSAKLEDGVARIRFSPGHEHSNMSENVHGGALLGFIDMALFAAARTFGVLGAGGASTLDLSTHFIAGAPIAAGPVEARIELLRETGRLLFLRGLIYQGETLVTEFAGTIRKPSR
jgi:acyl-coenzyme A thioesterase PaaI-like protein